MNVYASADGIAVVAELPGVEKDDLEIQAHRDTLTLRGSRRPPSEREEAYHRRERRSGPFTRSITLPYGSTQTGSRRSWRTACSA